MATPTRAQQPAVANARCLPRLALRNHVAANPSGNRVGLLSALSRRLSQRASTRRRQPRPSVKPMGRARLLTPHPQSTRPRAASCCTAWRCIPITPRRARNAKRSRAQHRRRHRCLCLPPARSHIRRQRETRALSRLRPRRRSSRQSL